jgi:hypothetical protein
METHSRYWSINHAVRTATGLVIVMVEIYNTYKVYQKREIFLVVIGSLFISTYYGSIWLTYLGAGLINDKIKHTALKALSKLEPKVDTDKQNILLLKSNISDGFSGMYVSGLHMTTEKAISIGGIVFTLMMILVKLHQL